MSQIETNQVRAPRMWTALPSVMLGLGFVLNVAWLALLAWGVFHVAGWLLS